MFYTFINKETGEEQTEMMKSSDLDGFIAANPHLEQKLAAPMIVSGHGHTPKHSSALNDKMKSWKKFYRGSTINAR